MSQEIQLRTSDHLPDVADPLSVYDRPSEQQSQLFRKLHRLFRNRYKWVVTLTLLGMALGGFGGYILAKQTYRSTGMVRIRPVLPVVLSKTDENSPLYGFDLFVQAQVPLLRSQRVIDLALNSDEWKKTNRPVDDAGIEDFLKNLEIVAPKGEIITVSFTDPDRQVASAAVKAVLTAYNKIYIEEGPIKEEESKRTTLEDRRRALTSDLLVKQQAIREAARAYGTDDLRALLDAKLQNLNRWETALTELDFELAGLEGTKSPPTTNPAGSTDTPLISNREIAMQDQGMRQLLRQLDDVKAELEFRNRILGSEHWKVKELQSLLAAKEKAVNQYGDDYRAALQNHMVAVPGAASGLSIEQLKQRQAKYRELVKAAQDEARAMGNQMLDIEKLRKELELAQQQLQATNRRLDELRTESPIQGGRIRIENYGDRAMPYRDNRVIRTAAGGMAGGAFGFGVMLLIALADRRLRNADDARSSVGKLALLGVLPSLPDDLSDPEQAAIAAHCVHQIRTLLQIGSPVPGSRVFAITSPAAGTGKTSLALALGVSFSATNSRTLLIDCDIVGGGLTARVDTIIRRKIGQILKREGYITQQQLDMAMKVAATSHRRLGEILVDLGFLTEADVAKALSLQEETPIGMLDALNGENIDDCVADTGIRGLSILPLGAAMPADAGRLSPAAVRKLIDLARDRYDTVLVDTGPVPGSLEASVVAAAADGVVLVVSRGEHRPLAERSLQHLHDIGAVVAGMVFNRAESRDMDLSTTTNRLSSYDRGHGNNAARVSDVVESGEPQKLGPIAFAVAGRGSAGKNGSRPQP